MALCQQLPQHVCRYLIWRGGGRSYKLGSRRELGQKSPAVTNSHKFNAAVSTNRPILSENQQFPGNLELCPKGLVRTFVDLRFALAKVAVCLGYRKIRLMWVAAMYQVGGGTMRRKIKVGVGGHGSSLKRHRWKMGIVEKGRLKKLAEEGKLMFNRKMGVPMARSKHA